MFTRVLDRHQMESEGEKREICHGDQPHLSACPTGCGGRIASAGDAPRAQSTWRAHDPSDMSIRSVGSICAGDHRVSRSGGVPFY